MKVLIKRPVLATILFGLACGVSLVPVATVSAMFFGGTDLFRLVIWIYLAGYGLMLARWNGSGSASIWPPAIPLAFAFADVPEALWFASVLLTLSWMRSSKSFKKAPMAVIGKELLVCFGGGALVAAFAPTGAVAWSLGIWMFFLVQSLWFVSFRESGSVRKRRPDPFERARRRAEEILASG